MAIIDSGNRRSHSGIVFFNDITHTIDGYQLPDGYNVFCSP